jgi:small subunit ribosomal protein S2
MGTVQVEDLLLAGSHFGHLTRRWDPKMRKYIFMERNGIHIIDLKKTLSLLEEAANAIIKDLCKKGRKFSLSAQRNRPSRLSKMKPKDQMLSMFLKDGLAECLQTSIP